MRLRTKWLIAFFVLVAVSIAAMVAFNGGKPVRVRVVRPQPGRVEEIVTANSVGSVEPVKTAVVAAEIVGRIRTIVVRQGPVKAGQPVVEIDSADLRAEREVTRRDGETQKMRLEQAAVAKQKVWEDLERLRKVDVPKSDVDRLERDLDFAKKTEEIARLSIRTLEAQLEVLDLKLRKTSVAAPFDGTVVVLHSEEGESVTPGKPLFTLHSAGQLLIRAPIDEVDMGRVALGLTARVAFDAYRDRKFEGSVHEIMPAATTDKKNNRTVDVKILIPDMPPNICAGMSANVEIIIRGKDNVLWLPTHLVHDDREGHGQFVFVVDDGAARRRFVETGYSNWETIEIVKGVGPADQVIVPLQFEDEQAVREGSKVVVADGK
jgi:HlyD family secretion protein